MSFYLCILSFFLFILGTKMNMLYLYPMHLPMVDGQAHECSHYTENLCYNEFLYNSLSYYHSVFKDLFFAYYYFVYVSKLSWVYGHYIHAGGWGGQKWMSGTLELEFLYVFVRCMLGNESGSSVKAPRAQIHESALQPQLSLIKKKSIFLHIWHTTFIKYNFQIYPNLFQNILMNFIIISFIHTKIQQLLPTSPF